MRQAIPGTCMDEAVPMLHTDLLWTDSSGSGYV